MSANSLLGCLLPEGWSNGEGVEDVVIAAGLRLHRAGVVAVSANGEEITGAAADLNGSPLFRSSCELLERVTTLEAVAANDAAYPLLDATGRPIGEATRGLVFPESPEPRRYRYARSNGVALHADFESACERAAWELVERHRVLRSWYGEVAPRELDLPREVFDSTEGYDWSVYEFPRVENDTFGRDMRVAGVFGFPKRDDAPLLLGYGARDDLPSALGAAMAESMQLLAFLWGEPVDSVPPEVVPSAGFHLARYQPRSTHVLLKAWLRGDHVQFTCPSREVEENVASIGFVDLTPSWMQNGFRVVKAIAPAAEPLAFGDSPFTPHMPPSLRHHPIP